MDAVTETITLYCDVYSENHLLLLSKGTKLELNGRRRRRLRHMGVLQDILEAADPQKALEKEEQDALKRKTSKGISLQEEAVIQQQCKEIHEAAVRIFANSALKTDSHFFQAATITEKLVHDCRNTVWYLHFLALMNYAECLYNHSINVALLSALIGLKLDYGTEELHDLVLGALLHDIGQILLPKKILLKPSEWTEVEYTILRSHCELGYFMMQDVGMNPTCNQIILQHHERNDGSGYPNGLYGNEILQTAKIVGIAEFYDTAITKQVYKKAKSVREAINCLRLFPQQYDEQLVGILSDYML